MTIKITNDLTQIDYPRYDSYKDSGVDWLGEIPEEWDLTPAFKFINENKLKNKGLTVDTVLSLSYGNILIKPKEKLTGLVPESFETYQIVEPNDIIIRCMDLQNDKTSLRIGLVKDKGIITSAYLALKVANSYLPEYLYYYLHSLDTSKAIYKMGTGLRQNLSFGDFKRFQVPNIPLKVQQRIVDFVKTKSAQTDQAIALKQQQIAKLEEYKQIVIQNAVTKGLNPDAPMKDSGVDWIGDIPEHWEMVSLRYLFKFLNYRRIPISADERGDMQGIYPYYGASGIIDYVNDYIFDEKLILIAEDGANLLSKSTPLAFVADGKYWVNNHAHILKPKYRGFVFWSNLLSLCDYTIYITGAAQPKLSRGNLGSVMLPVPPEGEILAISNLLEDQLSKFPIITQKYESQIDRLKEYKTILINQAVTGKIKIS
ncbi:restriction endonuclease subunit S [Psychrobacter celer]|uniref:restriction endonuclease subunit S n=2 Tax=Psychrobacter celer TaxID=306572 RepID=UPI003FD4A0B7